MRSLGTARVGILALSLLIAGAMGVRTPRVKAFVTGTHAGAGRVEVALWPSNHAGEAYEALAGMTFSTASSQFRQGLLVRTSFRLPRTDEAVVLTMDLDRANGRKRWEPGGTAMTARLYVQSEGGLARFDGVAVGGELELEAAFVRQGRVGFRIAGYLELSEPGPDGVPLSEDDPKMVVEVMVETRPTAEEVAGPGGAWIMDQPCELERCWDDQGPAAVGCTAYESDHDALWVEDPEPVGCADWDDGDDGWDWDDDDSSGWYDDDDDDSSGSWDDNGNSTSSGGYDDNGNPR